MHKIPFNKPYLAPQTRQYVEEALRSGSLVGNGAFTKKCHQFFEERYGFSKVLLTSSCTDALEMAALLCDIKPGDEVIMPSYTFVSTANAFALRGAQIRFADSESDNPCVAADSIESLITSKTKAIIVVHYGGIACDMDRISELAQTHGIMLVEDAAQAINSFWRGKALGSIGDLATFSFHETKNIGCGEGGMLVINNPALQDRAEIIWEKGTNRNAVYKKQVDKYHWIDLGSSFLPSDLTAACLFAQLQELDSIQERRVKIWKRYQVSLGTEIRAGATPNGHLFYVLGDQERIIAQLAHQNIQACFHYLPLHESPYYRASHPAQSLPNAERFAAQLVRLPLYCELSEQDQDRVIGVIKKHLLSS